MQKQFRQMLCKSNKKGEWDLILPKFIETFLFWASNLPKCPTMPLLPGSEPRILVFRNRMVLGISVANLHFPCTFNANAQCPNGWKTICPKSVYMPSAAHGGSGFSGLDQNFLFVFTQDKLYNFLATTSRV